MSVVENIFKEKGSWFEGQNWTINKVKIMLGSIEEDLDIYRGQKNRKIVFLENGIQQMEQSQCILWRKSC